MPQASAWSACARPISPPSPPYSQYLPYPASYSGINANVQSEPPVGTVVPLEAVTTIGRDVNSRLVLDDEVEPLRLGEQVVEVALRLGHVARGLVVSIEAVEEVIVGSLEPLEALTQVGDDATLFAPYVVNCWRVYGRPLLAIDQPAGVYEEAEGQQAARGDRKILQERLARLS